MEGVRPAHPCGVCQARLSSLRRTFIRRQLQAPSGLSRGHPHRQRQGVRRMIVSSHSTEPPFPGGSVTLVGFLLTL